MAAPVYQKDSAYKLPYEARGTQQTNTLSDFNKAAGEISSNTQSLADKKAKCLAKGAGWTWNEKAGICEKVPENNIANMKVDMSKVGNTQEQPQQATPKSNVNTTYSAIDFNKDGTVTLRAGDNVVTMTKPEYENYLKVTSGRIYDKNGVAGPPIEGGIMTEQTKQAMALLPDENTFKMQQQQKRMKELMALTEQGLLTSEELQAIQGSSPNIGQSLGAGLTGALPGIAAGAIGGATVGALGGPIGAVGGALIGGVGTFLNSMRSDIKGQQAGEFAADQTALSKGQTMLRSLITDTNQNPAHAAENIQLFYHTLNLIDAAHARTYKDSQENLNKFLGNDGTEQLAKFEVFDSTMRQYYITRFETALMNPDSTLSLINDEDISEFGGLESGDA